MKKEQVVSNTSVLLFLSKLDYLILLKKIFSKTLIPYAVFQEISSKKDSLYESVIKLVEENFIEIHDVENKLLIKHVSHNLHSGEAEAIVLALEHGHRVLLDDGKAREIALSSGLRIMGTLGILKLLKSMEYINDTDEELFFKLKKIKFRINDEQFFEIMRSI